MPIFVFILLLISFSAFAFPEYSGAIFGCVKNSGTIKNAEIESSILLNEKFLPEDPEERDQVFKKAIEGQLKFINQSMAGSPSNPTFVGSVRHPFTILSKTSVNYPELKINLRILPENRSRTSQLDYLNKALARTFTTTNDSAILIKYRTQIQISSCHKTRKGLSKIIIPLDPFLAFWIQNEKDYEKKQYGPYSLKSFPSCFSNEISMFGGVDDQWYFWQPLKSSAKECSTINGTTTSVRLLSEVPISPPKKVITLEPKNDKFFTAIFGALTNDQYFQETNYEKLKLNIEQYLRNSKASQTLKKIYQQKKPIEPGLYHFLNFMEKIKQQHKVMSYEVISIDKEILLNLRIDNNKQITNLKIYYGNTSTDLLTLPSKTYAKLWIDSLAAADAISYVGHAGLGKNLRLENLKKLFSNYSLQTNLSRNKPLWLGIYNCQAYSSFGEDFVEIFANTKPLSPIITLTLSTGFDSGFELPLNQFNYFIGDYKKTFNPLYKATYIEKNILIHLQY